MNKYVSIGKVAHNIPMLTKDVQMSVSSNAMVTTPLTRSPNPSDPLSQLIFVTGQLKIGENNPLLFSHAFQLVATAPGQYYVHNELFRLLYA